MNITPYYSLYSCEYNELYSRGYIHEYNRYIHGAVDTTSYIHWVIFMNTTRYIHGAIFILYS